MSQQPPLPPDSSYDMMLGYGHASPGNNAPILYCDQTKTIVLGKVYNKIYHIWDGAKWNSLKEAQFEVENGKLEIALWGNRVIGWGNKIKKIDGLSAPTGNYFAAIEYKNGQWDTLAGGTFSDSQVYKRLEFYTTKKDLYFSYEDPQIVANSKGYIYKYDTTVSRFNKIADVKGGFFFVCAGKNRLLVTSALGINNRSIKTYAYIDGDTIKLPTDSIGPKAFYYFIDQKNDHIYSMDFLMDKDSTFVTEVFDNSKISRHTTHGIKIGRGGTSWPFVSNGILFGSRDIKGVEWVSILCPGQIKWKDVQANGDNWTKYNVSETGIYAFDDSKKKIMELISGSSINGRAYFDEDSNCLLNFNKDLSFSNQLLSASSENFQSYTMTDDSGNYELFVLDDTISLRTPGVFSKCTNSSLIISSDTNYDISHKKPLNYDLKVSFLGGFNARWNGVVFYRALIENNGPPIDSAYFEFKFDNKLKVQSTQNSGISFLNDTIARGQIKNLGYYEKRMVYAEVWIDTGKTKIDTLLCNRFSCYPFKVDVKPSNNRDSIQQRVVYSRDPNHKDCDKEKIPESINSRLEYFIGFQNEGNDDAIDVVIVDTISDLLLMDSLHVLQASHSYTMSIEGQILKVTFANINLKSKKVDEAHSEGSIKFSVYTKNSILQGDSIVNKAYIYFDLNQPIVTNSAIVRVPKVPVSKVLSIENYKGLEIYPNPTKTYFTVKTETDASIILYNIMGEQLFSGTTNNGQLEIDISQFSPGLYILRCNTERVFVMKADQ